MLPQETVLGAFKRTFDANAAAVAALPGGLWANEVPEDSALPFGYLEYLGSRYEWTTEDFFVEHARVRVCVFNAGAERTEAAAKAVMAAFDWQPLLFENGTVDDTVQVMPTDAMVQGEFQRLRTGEVIYQAQFEYQVSINRNSRTRG